jgi:hypothetical protein
MLHTQAQACRASRWQLSIKSHSCACTAHASTRRLESPTCVLVYETSILRCIAGLGFSKEDIQLASQNDPRGVMVFKGGETAGLHRIQEYIFDNDCLKVVIHVFWE